MWSALKASTRPWVIASRMISGWWIHWALALVELRIGGSLGCQGNNRAICGFGLLLIEEHFMAEKFILKIIKVDVVLLGGKGIGGDKTGKRWIQAINNNGN